MILRLQTSPAIPLGLRIFAVLKHSDALKALLVGPSCAPRVPIPWGYGGHAFWTQTLTPLVHVKLAMVMTLDATQPDKKCSSGR